MGSIFCDEVFQDDDEPLDMGDYSLLSDTIDWYNLPSQVAMNLLELLTQDELDGLCQADSGIVALVMKHYKCPPAAIVE